MILSVCSNPDLLSIMLIINKVINLLKMLVPIGLIIFSSIDLLKSVIATDQEGIARKKAAIPKRALAAIIIFLIPSVINLVMIFANDTFEYNSCFTNATPEAIKAAYLNKADNAVAKAESTLNKIDYDNASLTVLKLENGVAKENYKARLAVVLKTIQDKEKSKDIVSKKSSSVGGSGKLTIAGSYSSSGNGVCKKGVALTSEPDPSSAINCWSYVNKSDFVYPKDPKTGLPLGAWPKNYASIPTQISGYHTYAGTFIFPITPTGNSYHFVYQHTGIDFMSNFGTPIYSPVDATLVYSEWGHTTNKGGDETSYSVTLDLKKAVTVQGVSVDTVFLTHMSGIIYRCSSTSNCNRTVKKGELLGFSGNAAGSSTSIGWAPHLHMTLYGSAGYDNGLVSTKIEALYGIPTRASSFKIQVGG